MFAFEALVYSLRMSVTFNIALDRCSRPRNSEDSASCPAVRRASGEDAMTVRENRNHFHYLRG